MMMGYSYGDGGPWMWVFGGLMMFGVLALIGAVLWGTIRMTRPPHPGQADPNTSQVEHGGRTRTRQILDERYARGEMTAEDYTERLRTLGL
jgi:putative membrane protein